jgi:hypothetical protein
VLPVVLPAEVVAPAALEAPAASEPAAVEAAPEAPVEPPADVLVIDGVASAPRPRRRARKDNGEFRADDPATPDTNEAFVEEPGEN